MIIIAEVHYCCNFHNFFIAPLKLFRIYRYIPDTYYVHACVVFYRPVSVMDYRTITEVAASGELTVSYIDIFQGMYA